MLITHGDRLGIRLANLMVWNGLGNTMIITVLLRLLEDIARFPVVDATNYWT